jgi:hypothetical protein
MFVNLLFSYPLYFGFMKAYERNRYRFYSNWCRVIMVKIQSFFYGPVVASKALPVASFLLVYVGVTS